MAKANVILLNSILWNLREVAKLADKIKKRCGDVDCASWRYPMTNCNELEIFKLLQSNRNLDNYTFILELTYDRLLYVLNLMIKYMETHDSMEKFRPKKNVFRPKTLSLASVLHMVWDRIQAQWEIASDGRSFSDKLEMLEKEKEFSGSLSVRRSSTCTQSEICAISSCSCCEMVQQFVTKLVMEMEVLVEAQDFESALLQERNLMKEYLVDLTSWSAMSRWLTAILKDFTVLAEKAEQATYCSRKLKSRLESGEQNLKARLEQYIEDARKLEFRIREHETNSHKMKQSLEELVKERKQLNEEIRLKNLEIAANARNSEIQMTELKKSYEMKLKERGEKKLKKEKEKEEEMRKKCKQLEEVKGQMEETIAALRGKVESLDARRAEERESLLKVTEENKDLKNVLEEKQKTLEDYSARLLEAYPELNGTSKPTYIASGVPEIDMANQMEANKMRIERLQSENEKLEKTLGKIKSLKG